MRCFLNAPIHISSVQCKLVHYGIEQIKSPKVKIVMNTHNI